MKTKLPILFYHKINNTHPKARSIDLYVPPYKFEEQMRHLSRRGYRSITFDDAVDKLKGGLPLSPKSVVITFDDGYLDNYEHAFPILKKYGLTATMFIVTDFVGQTNKWPHSREKLPEALMSWDNIREMAAYGISFGSHTCNHWNLKRLDKETELAHAPLTQTLSPEGRGWSEGDKIKYELTESKKKLESELQTEITTFCYPYGEYTDKVIQKVKQSGYMGACSTDHGNRHLSEDIYTLKRVFLWHNMPLWKFAYYLTVLYDIEHARKYKRKQMRKRLS